MTPVIGELSSSSEESDTEMNQAPPLKELEADSDRDSHKDDSKSPLEFDKADEE